MENILVSKERKPAGTDREVIKEFLTDWEVLTDEESKRKADENERPGATQS